MTLTRTAYSPYSGTVLSGRYYIGKAVGSGGFGIIYKAFDLKLEAVVAVKEFYRKDNDQSRRRG